MREAEVGGMLVVVCLFLLLGVLGLLAMGDPHLKETGKRTEERINAWFDSLPTWGQLVAIALLIGALIFLLKLLPKP